MKQRISEASSSLASQGIPHILQDASVHYRVQNSQHVPSRSTQYFLLKMHFNIIFQKNSYET